MTDLKNVTLKNLYKKSLNQINNYVTYINRLMFIERIFVLSISIVTIYIFWYLAFMLPMQNTKTNMQKTISTSEKQLKTIKRQLNTIEVEAKAALEKNKKQHDVLLEKVKEIDTKIYSFDKKLVNVSTISNILRETLDRQPKLKLQSLVTLPIKVIIKPIEDEKKLTEQGITFTFDGNYLDTLAYMQQLERFNIQLLWDNFKYDVIQYPKANVTVTLFLLNPPTNGETTNV